jgi:hypothetical protein
MRAEEPSQPNAGDPTEQLTLLTWPFLEVGED